jgi:hypothetical protein
MVDGGSFNGKTVSSIRHHQWQKIYYSSEQSLFSFDDYNDLYNIVQQACTNLLGTNGITEDNCLEVKDAVDAVEMNQQPANCTANEASLCPAGQTPNNIFYDDFEGGGGNWTAFCAGAGCGADPWWEIFTGYAASGTKSVHGNILSNARVTDTKLRLNNAQAIPANAYLQFNHSYGFENYSNPTTNMDGGVVEYSTDGGANWTDASALFVDNGYNGSITVTGTGNALEGRNAFVKESNGYYSSKLNLNTLNGQNVQFL